MGYLDPADGEGMGRAMKAAKKACSQCPFRKISIPGYLGPWPGPSELLDQAFSETGFVCHQTIVRDELTLKFKEEKMRICAGVGNMRESHGEGLPKRRPTRRADETGNQRRGYGRVPVSGSTREEAEGPKEGRTTMNTVMWVLILVSWTGESSTQVGSYYKEENCELQAKVMEEKIKQKAGMVLGPSIWRAVCVPVEKT